MKPCPTCGQPSPDDTMYCSRCGASLDQPEPAHSPTLPVEFAGIGRRLLAFIMDTVVLGLVYWNVWIFFILVLRTSDPTTSVTAALAVGFAASTVYFAWSYSTTGRTIGKKLLGIKVVSLDGSRLNWSQGILRAVGYIPSYVFGLGFLWAIWDSHKQTWHDKIAGTVVVRSWVAPERLKGVIQAPEVRRQQKQWRWGLGIATFLTLLSISSCALCLWLLSAVFQDQGLRDYMSDCPWNFTIKAWIDENQNARWDEGEPPLQGVRVSFDLGPSFGVETRTTDENGMAQNSDFGSCSYRWTLRAQAPSGYTATTPAEIHTDKQVHNAADGTYSFGFTR